MARNSDMSWEIRIRKLGERRAAARHKPEDGGARTALHGTHTIHTMHSVSSRAIVTVAHACTEGGAEEAIVGLARPEREGRKGRKGTHTISFRYQHIPPGKLKRARGGKKIKRPRARLSSGTAKSLRTCEESCRYCPTVQYYVR